MSHQLYEYAKKQCMSNLYNYSDSDKFNVIQTVSWFEKILQLLCHQELPTFKPLDSLDDRSTSGEATIGHIGLFI